MSFFAGALTNIWGFIQLVWLDLFILAASIAFCLLSRFLFPKVAGKQSPDKMARSVMTALRDLRPSAFGRHQKKPSVLQGNLAAQATLDAKGFPLVENREAYVAAIRNCQNNGGVDATFGLLKEMQRLEYELPASMVTRMFKEQSPAGACALLNRMQEAGVAPDVIMYNCIIGASVYGGDMKLARSLVEELREKGLSPDIVTYCTLLKGCHADGDMIGAKDLLREMISAGHRPREISYNALINAAVTSGDFQTAWDTIDMMKEIGVPYDGYTVSIMMKALRQRGSRRPLHSKHSGRVFEFLDSSKVDYCSDEVLLTTVVDTCVWHKEHNRLEGILEKYLKSNLKPSVPVYGSLIKATKCLKRIDLAWVLWKEVAETRGLQPNHIVLGCMLDALVCNNLVDEAVQLFREWKATVTSTTVIYSTLAKGFLNTNQAARAMEMLREMRSDGVPRSTVLYNMFIGIHAANGSMKEVSELLRSMSLDGCIPDIITYSSVVKGHCVRGDLDSAISTLKEAQQAGISLDAIVYSSIFYGCYRHNRQDLTDGLVAEMHSLGLTPSSFTLSIIVKLYGSQGNLNRAFEVAEMFSRPSNNSDPRVGTALLRACVLNGNLDRAERVFHSLAHAGGPDAKSFWPLVVCFVRGNELQRARALVGSWCKLKGSQASSDRLVQQLLAALGAQQPGEALALLDKLRVTDGNNAGAKGGKGASWHD